jgi:coenzyme A diphosphatase NUDT7
MISRSVTQLREAREEINLVDVSSVRFLCTLPPFISQWKLLVHPVVMLLTDISILDTLTPSLNEVDRIFTHPLDAIIDPSFAFGEPLSEIGSEDWPYEGDYYAR